MTEWLPLADATPHLLIVGETGSGKTTLAQALLAARNGSVAILDPKWTPGKWGGAPVVPIDDDGEYTGIERALQAVLKELQARLADLKHGQTDFVPLTIVIEEVPTVVDECPTAKKVVLRLGQLGRELQMRLIGLSQGYGVEDLGLKGRADNKANFGTIRLGAAAIKVAREAAQLRHPAVVEHRGQWELLDTREVPRLAERRMPAERWWAGADPVPAPFDDELDEQPVAPVWTEQHIRVAAWLQNEPGISIRELARRLYPGTDGGGGYSTMAKRIKEEVEQVLTVNCEAVNAR